LEEHERYRIEEIGEDGEPIAPGLRIGEVNLQDNAEFLLGTIF
jgi:hypothetical protein